MKNFTYVAELQRRLGMPSNETIEGLRLFRAFVRLTPLQRVEVIELAERLAAAPGPNDPPLS